MLTTEQTNTIQIDGQTYNIVKRTTVGDEIISGHLNSAREMKELKQAALLYVRKPKGSVVFFTIEFENGKVASSPVRLRRW